MGHYLDYNATAPARPDAVAAVTAALSVPGNPSSVHAAGRTARALMEDSRDRVAALTGASPRQVIFTSGGTEAMALALNGFSGRPVLMSAIEHPCAPAAAPQAERCPVRPDGLLDLDALAARLADSTRPPPAAVVVMLANNETGVIQPLAEVVALAKAHGCAVICDAVQALGKMPVSFTALDVDFLVVSGHKIGGPQGIGALIARIAEQVPPLMTGGGQERGKRGGTQNLPGIAGFGAAAAAVMAQGPAEQIRLARLRDRLEAEVRAMAPAAVIWGEDSPRLPNTSCIGLPGVAQQRQVMTLDLAGIAVSAGSACSSGKLEPSPVLKAMGASDATAREAIRISLGWATTEADVDAFLRAYAPLAAACTG